MSEINIQTQPRLKHNFTKSYRVKKWPLEVPQARDQLSSGRNWDLKMSCLRNLKLTGHPVQAKNKMKKKKEEGRWSWPKNYLKNLNKKWSHLPQFLETRFQKDHEGQRVIFQNRGKRTRWKMRNSQKPFHSFMHSVSVSLY